jgi:copper chaperone CopZ
MKVLIDVDCGQMPPECGFECGICTQKMKDAIEGLDGVLRFARHMNGQIEIEYDPDRITVERLLEVISGVPTGHKGSFLPSVSNT